MQSKAAVTTRIEGVEVSLITLAPKSDITVAAAGPAMKLAQSITKRSLNRFAGIVHSQAALAARDT